MFRPHHSRAEWAEDVFGVPLVSDLDLSDYEHLREMPELAAAVLAGAVNRQAAGVNILIHGPIGTAKPSSARRCRTLRAEARFVGQADEYGGDPNRAKQLASMRLAQRLLLAFGWPCYLGGIWVFTRV
jgi:transitional endoplasmic reticulum ATPase